ncbi:MAG: hypothetical protein GX663_05165 [Clostridiales bacterium]|nr:hypothetical protein [Clostridiales bacterium]
MFKKKNPLILGLICGAMIFTFTACGSDSGSEAFEKHAIPYPDGYVLDEAGASSYDGCEDHFDSPYWTHIDYYNMTSKDSLTIIPEFETYQQSTEYTCGPCSALMVLNHYDIHKYDELQIAELSGTDSENGVGVNGIAQFFEGIGWDVQRSTAGEATFDVYTDDMATVKFIKWVKKNLKNDTPIMVDWIDWAGHWQVIIGYDTMGTKDDIGDDVIIVADPYDTSDHYQDGYFTVPAERFFYMWQEGVTLLGEPEPQPWVIATPAE